jgi:hypothetical protein
MTDIKDFESKRNAMNWMYDEVDDPCIDNVRFAYLDEIDDLGYYEESLGSGCCGYFDEEISINGRKATIGCNYGH